MPKLRNYTSSVPVNRSVSYIEQRLVEAGATHIAKKYGKDQALQAVIFSLPGPGGEQVPIRLPANVDQCERVLLEYVKRKTEAALEKNRLQAERTAWKLLYDWVDLQCSMIKLGQVEPLEVFLAYIFDSKRGTTFYESLKGGSADVKMLPFAKG